MTEADEWSGRCVAVATANLSRVSVPGQYCNIGQPLAADVIILSSGPG
jgi:hypothetical protein